MSNQLEIIKKDISAMGPQFAMALPKHIPVEKFTRVLVTAVSTSPNLLDADRKTLFAACMKSAQDGLLPDGREAAIVTYSGKNGVVAQFMPMVSGILKKVRNSGELASITAQVVYKNDKFRYWVDSDGEHLEHEPNLFSDRGDKIGVYALAKTKDGAIYVEVLTVQQIESIKKVSRAQSGPWAGPFAEEMWKKSAIRRLAKRLPMSTDLDQVIHSDEEIFKPETSANEQVVEAVPTPTQKKKKFEQVVEAATPKDAEVVEVSDDEIPL